MKKYFIILMTLKLIDLFETKFIGEQKEDAVKELIYIDGHKTAQKNIDQQFLENIK